MNNFTAIVVIILVGIVLKPIMKGNGGRFGSSNYQRDCYLLLLFGRTFSNKII